jgi:hypothetical protein
LAVKIGNVYGSLWEKQERSHAESQLLGVKPSSDPLKVLSSEMDPAEIRLIQYASLKREVRKVLKKICPPPILCGPLKY